MDEHEYKLDVPHALLCWCHHIWFHRCPYKLYAEVLFQICVFENKISRNYFVDATLPLIGTCKDSQAHGADNEVQARKSHASRPTKHGVRPWPKLGMT